MVLSSAAPLVPSVAPPDSRSSTNTSDSHSPQGRLQRIVRWIDFIASCNLFIRIYASIKSRKFRHGSELQEVRLTLFDSPGSSEGEST